MKQRSLRRIIGVAFLATLSGCGLADTDGEPIPAVDADTLVTLDRTGCYGSCPSYSLKIAGDGAVTYVGKHYVKVKGRASTQVDVSDVQGLVDQMVQADYFDLSVPGECAAGIFSDASGATTSLRLGGRTQMVDHYHGNPCAPAILNDLEQAIDEVAGSAQWVECESQDGACCYSDGNPLLSACH
jgi:hypothetical protein